MNWAVVSPGSQPPLPSVTSPSLSLPQRHRTLGTLGYTHTWVHIQPTIGELPKLCVKIRPDSWLVCGPFRCQQRSQRNGPQTNQLSGWIFTHNLGNSPILLTHLLQYLYSNKNSNNSNLINLYSQYSITDWQLLNTPQISLYVSTCYVSAANNRQRRHGVFWLSAVCHPLIINIYFAWGNISVFNNNNNNNNEKICI